MKKTALISRFLMIVNIPSQVVVGRIVHHINHKSLLLLSKAFSRHPLIIWYRAQVQGLCQFSKGSNGVQCGQQNAAENGEQNSAALKGHDSIAEKNNAYKHGNEKRWHKANRQVQHCISFISNQFHGDSKFYLSHLYRYTKTHEMSRLLLSFTAKKGA